MPADARPAGAFGPTAAGSPARADRVTAPATEVLRPSAPRAPGAAGLPDNAPEPQPEEPGYGHGV